MFLVLLVERYRSRRSHLHLLWWAIGVFTYGLGTSLESWITLAGSSILATKLWYVAGALLGGYPLAQGTVFLLLKRRTAWILTAITVPLIAFFSVLVFLSPVNAAALEAHRPSGAVLGWQWIRLFTPFINLYAVFFLIGGAILSAFRFWGGRTVDDRSRALGNASIAFGAILPGIGGSFAKAGVVEALYVGELVGIVFIWIGYWLCTRAVAPTVRHAAQAETELATGTSPAG